MGPQTHDFRLPGRDYGRVNARSLRAIMTQTLRWELPGVPLNAGKRDGPKERGNSPVEKKKTELTMSRVHQPCRYLDSLDGWTGGTLDAPEAGQG
ncbi:hypothetical protein RB213_011040 [Colletotrichum asianum]